MGFYNKVSYGSKPITAQHARLLREAAREVGLTEPVYLAQGSWSDSVDASAGTHSGSGAADIRVFNIPSSKRKPFVAAIRKRGAGATWLRDPWPQGVHIHSLMGCGDAGDDPGLSTAAKRQVVLWKAGKNGLANNGSDPDPRPKIWPLTRYGVIAVRIAGKRTAVYSTQVLRVQRALAKYVGLNYSTGPGFWGKRTQAAWKAAEVKSGMKGADLFIMLGYRYGYRPAP